MGFALNELSLPELTLYCQVLFHIRRTKGEDPAPRLVARTTFPTLTGGVGSARVVMRYALAFCAAIVA
jgi:hypothetical protein